MQILKPIIFLFGAGLDVRFAANLPFLDTFVCHGTLRGTKRSIKRLRSNHRENGEFLAWITKSWYWLPNRIPILFGFWGC